MPKLETKGPLGFLEVRIIAKFQRKIEEGTFKNFQKKPHKADKIERGTIQPRPGSQMYEKISG